MWGTLYTVRYNGTGTDSGLGATADSTSRVPSPTRCVVTWLCQAEVSSLKFASELELIELVVSLLSIFVQSFTRFLWF